MGPLNEDGLPPVSQGYLYRSASFVAGLAVDIHIIDSFAAQPKTHLGVLNVIQRGIKS